MVVHRLWILSLGCIVYQITFHGQCRARAYPTVSKSFFNRRPSLLEIAVNSHNRLFTGGNGIADTQNLVDQVAATSHGKTVIRQGTVTQVQNRPVLIFRKLPRVFHFGTDGAEHLLHLQGFQLTL